MTDSLSKSAPMENIQMENLQDSALYNKDLAPVPRERRTWTTYSYAAL